MLSATICSSIYFGFTITVEIIIPCQIGVRERNAVVGEVCNYFIKQK